MEKDILFINKDEQLLQELRPIASKKDRTFDCASNGLDAVAHLKQHHYKLVITCMQLRGYDGEKIITYLNHAHPDTLIIVYTDILTPAQLFFLSNDRQIWCTLLYGTLSMPELEDVIDRAVLHYDALSLDADAKKERLLLQEALTAKLDESLAKLSLVENQIDFSRDFLRKLLTETNTLLAPFYPASQLSDLILFEKELIGAYQGEAAKLPDFKSIRQSLRDAFPDENGSFLKLDFPNMTNFYREQCNERIRYLIAIYLMTWKKVFGYYQGTAVTEILSANTIRILLRFDLDLDIWNTQMAQPLHQDLFSLTHSIARAFSTCFSSEVQDCNLILSMELDLKRYSPSVASSESDAPFLL